MPEHSQNTTGTQPEHNNNSGDTPGGYTRSMSNPQIENGNFTRIHNGILEALMLAGLSKNEMLCVLAVIRKTYGYLKTTDAISYGQLAEMTGLYRNNVMRTMASLVTKNIVSKTANGNNRPPTWKFNKYAETWATGIKTVPSSESPTGIKTVPSLEPTGIKTDTTTGIKTVPHKRKKEKEATTAADEVMVMWLGNMPGTMTPVIADGIKELENEFSEPEILMAIKIACERNRRSLGYVRGILRKGVDLSASNGTEPKEQVTITIQQGVDEQW